MTDAELAALCIADEAAGEPYAGKVAVGLVLRHRMAARFRSDGTVTGTVLAKLQFSGFWCEMEQGHYEQICSDLSQAEARAETLLAQFHAQSHVWLDCYSAWTLSGQAISPYVWPMLAPVIAEPRTLNYCNRALVSPAWATDALFVAQIGQHSFYRA